ncbi:serine hydrolase [Arthrobacter sp. B3I4]|uniref:serine hydrolase n=1 Tax=Arthrobacter sp. B3I4 TaxID=3042267 RepID=UPI0027D88C90|nr:serine hydrolase [Arthrobacter sp. B3I4]
MTWHGHTGPRHVRADRRSTALLPVAVTALLAMGLALGGYSAAHPRSTAAAAGTVTGTVTSKLAPAGAAVQAAGTAVLAAGAAAGTAAGTGAAAAGAGTAALHAAAGTIDPELETEINGIIDASPEYRIGVALVDLSGGSDAEVHRYGSEDPFVAASTAKVLAAEAFYHQVDIGAASLDEQLGDYSAAFQLQAMIQQSDNDSWALIMDAVGHAELTDYAASLGVQYSPESNALTPSDMARILAGLYRGTLLEARDAAQLLSAMQDTNDETLIPAAVPAGVTVFHKYGALDGELHDAAILAKDGQAYALVVYTSGDDLSSAPERTDIIHRIAAAVTDAVF